MWNIGACLTVCLIAVHRTNGFVLTISGGSSSMVSGSDLCSGVDCNHGDCQAQGFLSHCTCHTGWVGTHCNVYYYCQGVDCNNGTCRVYQHHAPPHHHYAHCDCDTGYSGTNCTTNDPCHGISCHHHGSCYVHQQTAHCSCDSGHYGDYCQYYDACHNYNCGHGICHHNSHGHAYCSCAHGYFGNRCQYMNRCVLANPCLHGTCHQHDEYGHYTCDCQHQYSGTNCDKALQCNQGEMKPVPGTGCKQYHACVYGYWSTSAFTCSNSLLFNVKYQTCDWAYHVDHSTCGSTSAAPVTTTTTTMNPTSSTPAATTTATAATATAKTTPTTAATATKAASTTASTTTTTTATLTTTQASTTTTKQLLDPCQDFSCEGHGACIAIVDQPYCACLAGYHGTHCEVEIPTTTTATTTTSTSTTQPTTTPTTAPTTESATATTTTRPITTSPPTATAATTTEAPVDLKSCNSTTTVTSIIHGTIAHNSDFGSCPLGSSATPDAFVLAHCALPFPSQWTQGISVQEHCDAIPLYTPVATFINRMYTSAGGLSGIFLGCLPGGFKLGVQQCDHSPTILHIVNGGVLTLDPSIYYTVQ